MFSATYKLLDYSRQVICLDNARNSNIFVQLYSQIEANECDAHECRNGFLNDKHHVMIELLQLFDCVMT